MSWAISGWAGLACCLGVCPDSLTSSFYSYLYFWLRGIELWKSCLIISCSSCSSALLRTGYRSERESFPLVLLAYGPII